MLFGKSSGIAAGPGGAVWFTNPGTNNIEQIGTSGVVFDVFASITFSGLPNRIVTKPDGAMWFTEQSVNKISGITVPQFLLPFSPLAIAVLPSNRSI